MRVGISCISKHDVQASFFAQIYPNTKVHHVFLSNLEHPISLSDCSKQSRHEEAAAYFIFSLQYQVCQSADVHLFNVPSVVKRSSACIMHRCNVVDSSPRHLYILSRGLVALNHRVGFDGAVPWR